MSEQNTATVTKHIVLNGVDVTALSETMDQIRENPKIADFKFRSVNRWIDGAHNRSTILPFYGALKEDTSRKQNFQFDADEPPLLLGKNLGANPVEFILHAAAACVTTTFVYYAAAEGISIDEIETTVEGDIDLRGLLGLDKNVPPEYQEIRFKMNVKADAPTEKIEELVRLAEMRSPSFNSVRKPVPMVIDVEHTQQ